MLQAHFASAQAGAGPVGAAFAQAAVLSKKLRWLPATATKFTKARLVRALLFGLGRLGIIFSFCLQRQPSAPNGGFEIFSGGPAGCLVCVNSIVLNMVARLSMSASAAHS
jgi:hypothetical protein